MVKKSKQKRPSIDPRVLTTPRVDALLQQYAQGELEKEALEAALRALMAEVGHGPVLDALLARLERAPDEERDALMLIISDLKSPEVVDYLWRQVRRPRELPLDVRMITLVVLRQMGEDVDISDPGRYFSPRDLHPEDFRSAKAVMRLGLHGLARSLRQTRTPTEVEMFMLRLYRFAEEEGGGERMLQEMVKEGERNATELDADLLRAIAHTAPFPPVRRAAKEALDRLACIGIRPVHPAVIALGQERFYAAYMTDPDHPWQQEVIVAWERAGGAVQALLFLIDFGFPWRGGIKDMFPTRELTPQEFQRDVVEKAERKMGMRLYRVSLARAQATLTTAVEVHRKYGLPLPPEYREARYLVERWVLHPPEEAIAADTTPDELGDRPLVPDYSKKPTDVFVGDIEELIRLGITPPFVPKREGTRPRTPRHRR